MISCDAVCYIAGAFALLILPPEWILSAVVAALVHEGGHLMAVRLCGGNIREIRIRITGCVIRTDPMGMRQSVICILAGPLGSFSLLVLKRYFPLMAVCGALQGAYNMFPVLPLDGGRVLLILLKRYFPENGERIMEMWGQIAGLTLLFAGIRLYIADRAGGYLLICALMINIRTLRRKIPCKENRIGLQWY